MSQNEIAVLLPVYGAQKKMEDTVASLRNQGAPFDIFIIDDGNEPPLTRPAFPERRDPLQGEVFVLRQSPNQGLIAALNRGIEEIRQRGYSYVARIDAGDLALPNRLSLQLEAFKTNPDLALCGGFCTRVDANGVDMGLSTYPLTAQELKKSVRYRASFSHPTVMMRLNIFDEIEAYRPGYNHAEDCELFFRIAQRYQTCNLPVSLLLYEQVGDSISAVHARTQALTTLRIYLNHFNPLLWQSWLGIASKLPNLFLSRERMDAIKKALKIGAFAETKTETHTS
ncbi:MAG: glycosyltransferase involved in cell wall biosynthesis [Parvibaculaceae bacterium]|jgi:glycosyltransferase involved in cell wall biosynthesis|nr:glycosyltransferase [Parvibaculaceae bacterium]